MTQSRESLITEKSFEEYFNNKACNNPDPRAVIEDRKRFINSQNEYTNGLSSLDIQFFNAEITDITDYFPNEYPLPIREFFSNYLHQGSLADITQTFYYITCLENQWLIPGSDKTHKINKKYHICLQQNDSVIYIEQFDIPYYRNFNFPEEIIPPSRPVPIAKILTISLINPDKVIKPQLIMHKIFVLDNVHGGVLFRKDNPHIEKCFDKSSVEVDAKIDAIILPFKIYGVLFSYNQLSRNKIVIPSFIKNPEWKKVPEQIDALLFFVNWIEFYNSLSTINWDHFAQDLVTNRFAEYFEIEKNLLPHELPNHIDIKEIDELNNALDTYNINYQTNVFKNLNGSKDDSILIKEFLTLQLVLNRARQDFYHFQFIMLNFLEKIVIPQNERVVYSVKSAAFKNECSALYHASFKCEDELQQAGYAFWQALEKIQKTKFSIDELVDLIDLIVLTERLVSNKKWADEDARLHIELYANKLNNYDGKYQVTTLPKMTASLGGAVTAGASGLGVAGAYSPALVAPIVATGPLIAPAVVTGLLLAGYGLFKWNKASKGEIYIAGENLIKVANTNLNCLQKSAI